MVAFDTAGSTPTTTGATSAIVDITAAATGAWVYLWVAVPSATSAASRTRWTPLASSLDTSASPVAYTVLRRQKQAGDTTFTISWTTSGKGVLVWASYTGLNSSTPDEGAAATSNSTTSRTAVPTPTATPAAANRWAVGFFAARTSTTANKNITWTPDAAQAERADVNNSAAASAAWTGTEIADTNGAVTQAAQSYTATHAPAAEAHDGSAILFLIPGSTTAAAGLATGTGTAQQPSAAVTAAAGPAAGTGGAQQPPAAITAAAGPAAGTGAARQPSAAVTPAAALPAGTGTAWQPAVSAAALAGAAPAAGAALNPSAATRPAGTVLYSAGRARLPWATGEAHLPWTTGQARLPWSTGAGRNT